MEKEILYDKNDIKIEKYNIDDVENVAIEYDVDSVIVFPYTTDSYGNIKNVGILDEYDPLMKNEFNSTLINDTVKDEDETSMDTAKRLLYEYANYDVSDDSKWKFYGNICLSKVVKNNYPIYAVNLTDIKEKKYKGSLNAIQKKSKFKFIKLAEAIRCDNSIILSSILKYFLINYSNIFKVEQH